MFEMHKGILCRIYYPKGRAKHNFVRQICIPSAMQGEMVKSTHEELSVGGTHWGYDRTLANLRDKYFWHSLAKDTMEYCKTCPVCQGKKGTPKRNASMQIMTPVTRVLQRVAIDIAGPLVESGPEMYKYTHTHRCLF